MLGQGLRKVIDGFIRDNQRTLRVVGKIGKHDSSGFVEEDVIELRRRIAEELRIDVTDSMLKPARYC